MEKVGLDVGETEVGQSGYDIVVVIWASLFIVVLLN